MFRRTTLQSGGLSLLAIALLGVSFTTSACSKSVKLEPGTYVAAKTRLAKKLESRPCARPALRDGLTEKATGLDALTVALTSPAATACLKALGQKNKDLTAAFDSGEKVTKPWSPRGFSTPSVKASVPADLATCDEAFKAFRQVIRQDSLCGPLPDRKVAESTDLMRLSKFASLQAMALWRAKKSSEALNVVLDTVRLGQDLARQTHMAHMLVGTDMVQTAVVTLETMLNDTARTLDVALLQRVAKELSVVLSTDPGLSGTFLAEASYSAMTLESLTDAEVEQALGGLDVDRETFMALQALAIEEELAALTKACPAGSTATQCFSGAAEAQKTLAQRRATAVNGRSGAGDAARRTLYVDSLLPTSPFDQAARRMGRRRFLLSAALIHAKALAASSGACPEAVSGEDASAKKPVVVRKLAGTQWELTSAMEPAESDVHYRIDCSQR